MSRKLTKFLVIASVLVMMMAFWTVTQAQDDVVTITPDSRLAGTYPVPDYDAMPTEGPITAMIVLADAPAGEVFAAASDVNSVQANLDAQARHNALMAAQNAFSAQLQADFGIQTVGNLTFIDNAVIVNMDASQIDAVRGLPNVLAVYPDEAIPVDNSTSVPFINASELWRAGADGATGDGVTIGIVDSGIDYFHAHFGGSGDPADYAANDPSVVEPGSFPTQKVIGGYDFVGNNWGTPTNFVAFPDPDPVACDFDFGNHGNHVAGTAAGFGVTSAGETFTGDYTTLTDEDIADFQIGPGVAPEAELYAFKIGGCEPFVSALGGIQAWDMAFDPNGDGNPDDRVDVINNSWGSTYGNMTQVIDTQINLAVAAGINFVGSAGNSSDVFFIAGAPNIADGNISVASSVDAGIPVAGFVQEGAMTATALGTPAAFGPPLDDTGVSGDVLLTTPADGCTTISEDLTDAIAIIDRGGCFFSTKVYNAQLAGASGVIIANNIPGDGDFVMGPGDFAELVTIPSIMVSFEEGELIKGLLPTSGTIANVTSAADTISGFTSRGPRGFDGNEIVLKPDVAAPGQSITSALAGTGTDSETISGTSMAAPHVAGVAALVREANPEWNAYQVKAAIMNTATNPLFTDPDGQGEQYAPPRVGAGRVDANNAATTSVIAYNSNRPDRVSLSFGLVEVVGSASATQTITVENTGDTAATYSVSVDTILDTPGVDFTVSESEITVPAGGTATVNVQMSATAADMRRTADPSMNIDGFLGGLGFTFGEFYITEESGNIVLTPSSGESEGASTDLTLVVPFHTVTRPSSDMGATVENLELAPGEGTTTLALEGTGVVNPSGTAENPLAGLPEEVLSLVTPMELGATDTCGDMVPYPSDTPLSSNDLRYVGVTSDYSVAPDLAGTDADPLNDTFVYFGIVTCGPIDTFNNNHIHIFVDSYADGNWDGTADYQGVIFNFGDFWTSGQDDNEEFHLWFRPVDPSLGDTTSFGLYVIPPNSVPPAIADTSAMLSDATIIPIPAALLGLTPEASAIQYFAATTSAGDLNGDFVHDVAFGESIFDPANAVFAFNNSQGGGTPIAGLTGQPTYPDIPGFALPIEYNTNAGEVPDILLIHHHNPAGDRAEVVTTTVQPEAVDAAPTNLAVRGITGTMTGTFNLPVEPTFSWTHRDSDGANTVPADWYLLYVQRDDGLVAQEWYPAGAICTGTSCEVNPWSSSAQAAAFGSLDSAVELLGLENGDYTWYAVPWTQAGGTDTTNFGQSTFSVDIPAVEEPVGISPRAMTGTMEVPGLTETRVFFEFYADDAATWYNVYVGTEDFSETLVSEWYEADRICFGETCGFSTEIYATGNYTWFVRAYGPAGVGPWSTESEGFPGYDFDLEAPDAVGVVERIRPLTDTGSLTGTADPTITFEWEDNGAEWYRFELWSTDGGYTPYYTTWLPDGPYCNGVTCSISNQTSGLNDGIVYPVNGSYDWYVFGWNLAGFDADYGAQGTAQFSVNFPTPTTVPRLTPEDGFTYADNNVVLSWEGQPNTVAWYQVFVSDPTFTDVGYFDFIPATQVCPEFYSDGFEFGERPGVTCSFDLPGTQDAGQYVWWIRAFGPGGASDWVGSSTPFVIE